MSSIPPSLNRPVDREVEPQLQVYGDLGAVRRGIVVPHVGRGTSRVIGDGREPGGLRRLGALCALPNGRLVWGADDPTVRARSGQPALAS